MKKFRIAKCLDWDGKGIHEYAIFEDGSEKKIIKEDEEFGKYFNIDNELNTSTSSARLRSLFSNRIKDAIDTIRNGNGDCIRCINFLGNHIYVLYFLDRNIGDKLRMKTIEGWKDTKFAWCINTGNKNSFSPAMSLNIDDEAIGMFTDNRKEKLFNTEKEAADYVNQLLKRAFEYAKNFSEKLDGISDSNKQLKIYDEMQNKLESEGVSKNNIIKNYMLDMLDNDCTLRVTEPQLCDYYVKIVQCVYNTAELYKEK